VSREAEAVTPVTLLGDTRRRALAGHVRAAVERWRRSWAEDTSSRVSVEISGGEYFAGRWSSQSGFQARSPQGMIYLFVAARCLPVIAGVCPLTSGGVDRPVDPSSLAAHLEEEALRHLARELLAAARTQMSSFGRIALGIRQAALQQHAVASITLGEADASFSIAFDPQLLAILLPPLVAFEHEERVESRRAAISEQPVEVQAVLGQVDVSVRELAQLSVGDVVVLDESLSDVASFQVAGGGRVGRISIGRCDGRRAVQFRGKIQ
jgi:flagellar motor switch/type III secretory pathway protein FliN